MARISIVNLEQEHVTEMRGKLRLIDEVECKALSGSSADSSLQSAFEQSYQNMKWCILADEVPVAAFGCSKCIPNPDLGVVWMLATDRYLEARQELKELGPVYLGIMFTEFSELANFVMANNERSIRWLKRLGFIIDPPYFWGGSRELFHYFHMTKERLDKCVNQ